MPSFPTAEARFLFFGGKGGAGKTTCAAAAAVGLSRGQRVLALSLDPAHSLRDVLGPIAAVDIVELDARQEFAEFMRQHREHLRTIADRGTYLDDEDISGFLDLSLPGLDEIMGLLKLGQLARGERYDHIVVDLPPTGHALRLFDVSRAFDQLVDALELMQDKHRFMVSSLARRYAADEIDAFLEDLRRACTAGRETILSGGTAAFVLVTQPRPMVLAESVRYARRLRELGVPPAAVVINAADDRGADIPAELLQLPMVHIPLFDQPPVGAQGLAQVWKWLAPLFGPEQGLRSGREDSSPSAQNDKERAAQNDKERAAQNAKNKEAQNDIARSKPAVAGVTGRLSDLLDEPRRLTIFGGKGGVGKTTMAAAVALGLARRYPKRSVVAMSIDPAHSLGDSLGLPLGDELRQVTGRRNLMALEIDPARRWQQFQDHWAAEGQQLFAGLGGAHLDPVYDRQIAAQLGDIRPSGLDELQAATAVIDLLQEDTGRLIVVDAAPTGHLIRFLESPTLVLGWAKELMRVLLKYKLASRLRHLSEDLLRLSRQTKALQAALRDSATCELVVVTLAEPAVMAETERLIERLERLEAPVRRVIENQLTGAHQHDVEVERLRQRFPGLRFIGIPRQPTAVQGIEALEALEALAA